MIGLHFNSGVTFEDGENAAWEGTIYPLSTESPYEANVCARGSSFHIILGEHSHGRFLCIPNWQIGVDIASPNDRFWNFERLLGTGFSLVDASSIADALVQLSKYLNL